jgi:hypothetical protein
MQNNITLNPSQEKFRKSILSPSKFLPFLFFKLPSAFISGLRVRHFDTQRCDVSVPYKWLSQNPFKSTYFACLAMAAEMSTGLPAMMAIQGIKPGVSMLVVDLKAEFVKKATSRTLFSCEDVTGFIQAIEKAVETGEGVEYKAVSVGRLADGQEVARFTITWSFKQKSKN